MPNLVVVRFDYSESDVYTPSEPIYQTTLNTDYCIDNTEELQRLIDKIQGTKTSGFQGEGHIVDYSAWGLFRQETNNMNQFLCQEPDAITIAILKA